MRHIPIIILFCLIPQVVFSSLTDDVHIIIIACRSPELGGTEMHNFVLYKTFLSHNYSTEFVITPESKLETHIKSSKLPYHTFTKQNLALDVLPLCRKDRLNIVICTTQSQLLIKPTLEKYFRVKTLLTLHLPMEKKTLYGANLQHADAIVSANKETLDLVKIIQKQYHTRSHEPLARHQQLQQIAPFFDEQVFLNFSPPKTNHHSFFKTYGIKIGKGPVIAVVANMYRFVGLYKNFPLLFAAVKELIARSKTPFNVVIAGDGERRPIIERMAIEMGLQKHVHFLGFVKNTPELLFHSNFHVLPSIRESFGLVHIEAGMLRKASIGAYGTGAEIIIKDGETGFLFENNNASDLAKKIELLLNNTSLQKELGNNAYAHVKKNFLNETKFRCYEGLLEKMIQAPITYTVRHPSVRRLS